MNEQLHDGFFNLQSDPPELKDHETTTLVGQAVRGRWAIPESEFEALPQRLIDVVKSGNPRTSLKAAKLLLDMNAQLPEATAASEAAGRVVIYLPDNNRGPKPGEYGNLVIVPSSESTP